jgi:hypothetical protein
MATSNSCNGSRSKIVYKERISEIALGTGMFGYKPLKSNEEMLIGVCGEQCLNARLALLIAVSVSGHMVLIRKVEVFC